MKPLDVSQLADEAPFTRQHAAVIVWCFAVLVLDGYDLAVAGIALPLIMKQMQIDATTAGFMLSSALFGMMFGALLLGTLADRIGRRRAIAICVFLFSVFTAAAGFTHDPVAFGVLRFMAGLGIGGAIPNLAAHMTEYAPRKWRSLMVTGMACGYPVGSMVATLLGKQFMEVHGWQSVFMAAGVPVLLVPLVLRYLPESLPFLLRQGRQDELRAVLGRLRPDLVLPPGQAFTASSRQGDESSALGQLFKEGRALSTLMFWVAYIACLFVLYALNSWLVKLMGLAGHSLGSSLNFVLVYNAGGICGAIAGGWLADRLSIKGVTLGFCLLGALSLTLLGYGVQPLFLMVALVGASSLGTQILLYTFAGQFYPTSIRSTGLGFASGVGRLGALIGPIAIGLLVSMNLPLAQNFIAIGLAALIGAMAVAFIRAPEAMPPRPVASPSGTPAAAQ